MKVSYFLLLMLLILFTNLNAQISRKLDKQNQCSNMTIIDSLSLESNKINFLEKSENSKLFISGYEEINNKTLSPISYYPWTIVINSELINEDFIYLIITDSLKTNELIVKIEVNKKPRLKLGLLLHNVKMESGIYNCCIITEKFYSIKKISWSKKTFYKYFKFFGRAD